MKIHFILYFCGMITTIHDFKNPFFIGVAGTGMSAIAQYLQGIGKKVTGSDRYFERGEALDIKNKLEAEGIGCFLQNGEGITSETDLVVCSTAIEDTVLEVVKAKELHIPIIKRSELLAIIAQSKKTIAVGGTSGKSTTSAMLFNILEAANMQPSIISGAGLVSIIQEGKIGNAKVGSGEWLVIEADESDGSIVQYTPEVGLLLNVDKDHKDIDELMQMFLQFKNNSSYFITNQSHYLAKKLSVATSNDFSIDETIEAGVVAKDFVAEGFSISFNINNEVVKVNAIGKHSMENATAAITVALYCGASLQHCVTALSVYEGIYRRHQIVGKKNDVWLIDDYAHNPVKCAMSIKACQPLTHKVIAWFQPHGYGPTKFLRKDFVEEISAALREADEIWMSEIFYAGGTAVKDISAKDLIEDIRAIGKKAFFVEDRNDFLQAVTPHLEKDTVLLLMGARDPSLEQFTKQVWEAM
jgi:UDP-N-acetylmuramate--alanine ligase